MIDTEKKRKEKEARFSVTKKVFEKYKMIFCYGACALLIRILSTL